VTFLDCRSSRLPVPLLIPNMSPLTIFPTVSWPPELVHSSRAACPATRVLDQEGEARTVCDFFLFLPQELRPLFYFS